MAELLGVLGTVATLSSLATEGVTIVKTIRTFIREIKGAPEEAQNFLDELSSFSASLEQFATTLGTEEDEKFCNDKFYEELNKTLDTCKDIFEEIKTALEKSFPGISGSVASLDPDESFISKGDQFKWPFSRQGIIEIQQKLRRTILDLHLKVSLVSLTHQLRENRVTRKKRANEERQAKKAKAIQDQLLENKIEHLCLEAELASQAITLADDVYPHITDDTPSFQRQDQSLRGRRSVKISNATDSFPKDGLKINSNGSQHNHDLEPKKEASATGQSLPDSQEAAPEDLQPLQSADMTNPQPPPAPTIQEEPRPNLDGVDAISVPKNPDENGTEEKAQILSPLDNPAPETPTKVSNGFWDSPPSEHEKSRSPVPQLSGNNSVSSKLDTAPTAKKARNTKRSEAPGNQDIRVKVSETWLFYRDTDNTLVSCILPITPDEEAAVVAEFVRKKKLVWKYYRRLPKEFHQTISDALHQKAIYGQDNTGFTWSIAALKIRPKRKKGKDVQSVQLVLEKQVFAEQARRGVVIKLGGDHGVKGPFFRQHPLDRKQNEEFHWRDFRPRDPPGVYPYRDYYTPVQYPSDWTHQRRYHQSRPADIHLHSGIVPTANTQAGNTQAEHNQGVLTFRGDRIDYESSPQSSKGKGKRPQYMTVTKGQDTKKDEAEEKEPQRIREHAILNTKTDEAEKADEEALKSGFLSTQEEKLSRERSRSRSRESSQSSQEPEGIMMEVNSRQVAELIEKYTDMYKLSREDTW